ncbi:MAG: hypothetical protein ACLFPD_12255 [Desulfosudaceae bacterium]
MRVFMVFSFGVRLKKNYSLRRGNRGDSHDVAEKREEEKYSWQLPAGQFRALPWKRVCGTLLKVRGEIPTCFVLTGSVSVPLGYISRIRPEDVSYLYFPRVSDTTGRETGCREHNKPAHHYLCLSFSAADRGGAVD